MLPYFCIISVTGTSLSRAPSAGSVSLRKHSLITSRHFNSILIRDPFFWRQTQFSSVESTVSWPWLLLVNLIFLLQINEGTSTSESKASRGQSKVSSKSILSSFNLKKLLGMLATARIQVDLFLLTSPSTFRGPISTGFICACFMAEILI